MLQKMIIHCLQVSLVYSFQRNKEVCSFDKNSRGCSRGLIIMWKPYIFKAYFRFEGVSLESNQIRRIWSFAWFREGFKMVVLAKSFSWSWFGAFSKGQLVLDDSIWFMQPLFCFDFRLLVVFICFASLQFSIGSICIASQVFLILSLINLLYL